MKAIVCIFSLVLLTSASAAGELDVRSIVIDGKDFVAFDVTHAQKLLDIRIKFPKLELKITKQTELLVIKELQIGKLIDITKNLTDQKSALTTENTRLQVERDKRNAWYRSPYLWFCVGMFVGAGTAVGISYATKR